MDTLEICGFGPEQGRVVVELRAQEFHYNPLGTVHGGVLATLLDTAAACSVHSTLEVGEMYTSMDLNTKFLRAGHGRVRPAHLRGLGDPARTAYGARPGQLTDEQGRLIAHATSTCMIFHAAQG